MHQPAVTFVFLTLNRSDNEEIIAAVPFPNLSRYLYTMFHGSGQQGLCGRELDLMKGFTFLLDPQMMSNMKNKAQGRKIELSQRP